MRNPESRRGGGLSLLAASLLLAGPAVESGAGSRDSHHSHHRFQRLFAVVDAAGGLVAAAGVASVAHLGVGQYEVTFTKNVEACSYVATPANAYSEALTAFTAGGHLSAEGVYVETKNQGGGLTDGPFHLIVACRRTGMGYAVVGYAADLVRSTPGTSLTPLGFGRYTVRFPEPIAGCAFLASVGDPGNELVFNPSGVYTGTGPGARSVYVETKNPGGGLQDGVPFHLAVVCSGTPGARVAVVEPDGLPARASRSTSSFRAATGQYALVGNRSLESCASVATRGSVDTAVPFTPATVEIVPGPAPNTVGFEVRNLLFFGGAPLDEAFHAATICGE